MRTPLAISLVMHLAVVTFAALGLPSWWERKVIEPAPMVIELVNVADKTVQKKQAEKPPEPKPEPEVKVAEEDVPKPPEPPKKKDAAPPPPRRVEAAPPPPPPAPPEAKPVPPEPPPPPPASKPEVVQKQPEPEDKPAPAPQQFASVPTPMVKPTLDNPKKPEKKFDLDRLQALLDKRQANKSTERVESRKHAKAATPQARAAAADNQLTVSEIDAIRAQLSRCWSVPAGARDVENMRVEVRVFLRPDGSLERPPEVIDNMEFAGNPFFRTFAESARRAVQKCDPLQNLPVEKYEQWRELTINFDPKEMLRG